MCSLSITPSIPASSASTRHPHERPQIPRRGHRPVLAAARGQTAATPGRSRSTQNDADGQPLQPIREVRPLAHRRSGQLDRGDPRHKLLRYTRSSSRARCAPEALVWAAPPERQMVGRVAGDVEAVRIRIVVGVAVAGGEPHDHLFAGGDLDIAHVTSRVAVRRKNHTGEENRSSSSVAERPGRGRSAGARTRRDARRARACRG